MWLSKVIDQLYKKKGGEMFFDFFQPQKWLGTIEYHPNIHIIE